MPTPRIFVSSTCYDLKYIRENLTYFVRTLGYEPVLSEEGAVFYDPALSVQDACLAEVSACQLFVLIIGGRYGAKFRDTDKSVTNAEYLEAVKAEIPIFALVERSVHEQYRLFLANRNNLDLDARKIAYPAVDSTHIFDFIESVQGQAVNNALVPFGDFEEMQDYLKGQWAAMLFRFLTTENEAKRVGTALAGLSGATQNIEFVTRQLLNAVGDPVAKAMVEFYDFILGFDVTRDLTAWNLRPSPKAIVQHDTLDSFCGNQIMAEDYDEEEGGERVLTHGGPPYRLGTARLEDNRRQYLHMRGELLKRLKDKHISPEQFLGQP